MEGKIEEIKKLIAGWQTEKAQNEQKAVLNAGAVQAGVAILGVLTRKDEDESDKPSKPKKVKAATPPAE